ncbi:hypothetical protein PG996_010296 [Apiospora saccharicola]|uniref:Uncharacterized protein n=1 Tax=Apiospora saccharicola TaxID=335842 RepID=A0ABR1UQL6_9PEZI
MDALLSVRLVTAAGAVVTASATENGDLFWALRGAGANFGIVTSATYRVFELFRNMHRDRALDQDVDELMRSLRGLLASTSGLGGFERTSITPKGTRVRRSCMGLTTCLG